MSICFDCYKFAVPWSAAITADTGQWVGKCQVSPLTGVLCAEHVDHGYVTDTYADVVARRPASRG
jgi:hypothetical protein